MRAAIAVTFLGIGHLIFWLSLINFALNVFGGSNLKFWASAGAIGFALIILGSAINRILTFPRRR